MDDAHTTEIVTADGGLRTDPGLPPSAMIALENSMRSTKGAGRGPRSIARQLGTLTSVLVLAVVAAGGFLAGVKVQKNQAGTTTTRTAAATTGGGAAARAAAAGTASTATGGTAAAGAAGTGAAGAAGTGAGAGAGAAGAGRRGAGGAAGAAGAAGGTASTVAGAGGAAADTGAAGAGAAGGAAARAGFAAGGGAVTAGQVKLVDGNNLYVTDAQGNVVKVTTSDASRFTRTGLAAITDIHPGDTIVVQGSKGADGIVSATAVADTGASATGG